MAIGIVASGFGLGGLLIPVVTKLIDVLQWRTAMVAVGIGTLVIVLPLSLVVRHKPEDYGYQPDGETSNREYLSDTQPSRTSLEVSISAKQALKRRAFWYVSIASMCQAFVVSAVLTHIMPYLGNLGITRSLSSLVALIVPITSIGGRLGSAWLCDKWGNKQVFTASYALLTMGLLLFGYISSERMWLLVPFIITLSFGWGISVTTRISLLREYFGMGSFGTILGFVSGIMMLGNITGAPVAGWVFDTWGTYQGAWLSFGVLTIVGVLLALSIPSSNSTSR